MFGKHSKNNMIIIHTKDKKRKINVYFGIVKDDLLDF